MKKLRKLEINPERLIRNQELITLRGGYSWTYSWDCYNGSTFCGCIKTVSGEQYIGDFYCGWWWPGCGSAIGPKELDESCKP